MKISDRQVILAVSQHLRTVHGINQKNCWRGKEESVKGGTKVFGVPLKSLQQCYIEEYGLVPCFLVDACSNLLEHVDTVGLFRKSGSLVRLRTLRVKLDHGEACLSTGLPCDVASLLKQFCRELPEPLFPSNFHIALIKAQLKPTQQERTSASQLLSCLLPDRNLSFLRYFFNFLTKVSQRCAENQMSSSNLAVMFAPSLLRPSTSAEGVDGCLKLKADVVHTFIENGHLFGVVPEVILESVPVLLDSCLLEEEMHGKRRRGRRSRRGLSSVPPVPLTPVMSKGRYPSGLGERYTPKMLPSLRKSLGMEAFPDILLFRSETSYTVDQPESSPSALLDSPVRRESNIKQSRRIQRTESGSVGCFSSKLTPGRSVHRSPVLTGLGKLSFSPWRRRSIL